MRLFAYSSSVELRAGLDPDLAAHHLADCLRRARASSVSVEARHVRFKGGLLRFVSNWNVLVPFGSGEMFVDAKARRVRYRADFGQLIVGGTLMVGAMGTLIMIQSPRWTLLSFLPFMWLWIVGMNLAIGIPRFNQFVRQSLKTAGYCSVCGYDLRATPLRCPECGTEPARASEAET